MSKKKIDKNVVRRLLIYTKPYRGYLIAAMVSAPSVILQNITSKNVLLKHFLFFAKRHWTRSLIWNPFRRHLILH